VDEEDKGGAGDNAAESYRKAAPYVDAAWGLLGGMLVGSVAGYFGDRWLGTRPWLLVVGLLLGLMAGFVSFFSIVLKLGEKK
jgi:ATP synthase protein I